MQGNLFRNKYNTVDWLWQFLDRALIRSWVAILLFTAAYLAVHGLVAIH
jgi:hypothetical protein